MRNEKWEIVTKNDECNQSSSSLSTSAFLAESIALVASRRSPLSLSLSPSSREKIPKIKIIKMIKTWLTNQFSNSSLCSPF